MGRDEFITMTRVYLRMIWQEASLFPKGALALGEIMRLFRILIIPGVDRLQSWSCCLPSTHPGI